MARLSDAIRNYRWPWSGVEQIIRWSIRALWLLLFLVLMLPMGYWGKPWTLYYVAGMVCLILPMLFSKKELLDFDKSVKWAEVVLLNEQERLLIEQTLPVLLNND